MATTVYRACLVVVLAGLLSAQPVVAQPGAPQPGLAVVVTSKPIHALVSGVMRGVGQPALLVDGQASPHNFAMKPSDAQRVNKATAVFRVSEVLEPFTNKMWRALPTTVRRITLADAAGVSLLQRRNGGTFEQHGHGTARLAARAGGHGGHAHHREASSAYDAHVWLDPDNALAMVAAIAATLGELSPANAAHFQENAKDLIARIKALSTAVAHEMAPVAHRPFLVLHDAYQYFERRFGLTAIGSIMVDPDEAPSARRITDLRKKVQSLSAVCVFAEPHYQPGIVTGVTEGTSARTAILDPEGTTLTPGPELYFTLMEKLATAMKSCLAATS